MSKLKELIQRKAEIEAVIAGANEQLEAVSEEIGQVVSAQLAEIRKLQSKEFGAVNVTIEGYKFIETIPKKVKLDQVKMADIFGRILAAGDTPGNYMKAEFTVPEKMYDGFSPAVRNQFDAARLVEKGKPKIEIEEVES